MHSISLSDHGNVIVELVLPRKIACQIVLSMSLSVTRDVCRIILLKVLKGIIKRKKFLSTACNAQALHAQVGPQGFMFLKRACFVCAFCAGELLKRCACVYISHTVYISYKVHICHRM